MIDLLKAYALKCKELGLPVHDGDGARVKPENGWKKPHLNTNVLATTSLAPEEKKKINEKYAAGSLRNVRQTQAAVPGPRGSPGSVAG